MQNTSHVLMIRPVNFDYNAETAVNNHFQVRSDDRQVQQKAKAEFEGLIAALELNGIDVTIVNDTPDPHTPDSIFPNNWVSFHEDGSLLLYPMFAENRRLERKQSVLDAVAKKFDVKNTIDFSVYEKDGHFLEGTGSLVLDRNNKIAYACLSPRTDTAVLADFCKRMNYHAISFTATDGRGQLIYHTNVMMCVADRYVVICLDSVRDKTERKMLVDTFAETGKTTISITLDQMDHFAGNMLQLCNDKGQNFLVMSTQAFNSLTEEQVTAIKQYNPIIHSDISTIESNGGGSARCMIAEIFLGMIDDLN